MNFSRPEKRLSLFYCFDPADKNLLSLLDDHLSMLKRQEEIESWSLQDISAGCDREQQYIDHLQYSDLILLLISSDFLSSEERQRDIQVAMKRYETALFEQFMALRPLSPIPDYASAHFLSAAQTPEHVHLRVHQNIKLTP